MTAPTQWPTLNDRWGNVRFSWVKGVDWIVPSVGWLWGDMATFTVCGFPADPYPTHVVIHDRARVILEPVIINGKLHYEVTVKP